MARLILLTDFSEEYAKRLLKGIIKYSKEHEPWTVCKMPLAYRDLHGIEGVVKWALEWGAEAIIGQFYSADRVELFLENNILAVAQDFKKRFETIPNITGAHYLAGQMCGEYFIKKGFKNFGFFGFKNIVWSEERFQGYRDEISKNKMHDRLFEYQNMGSLDLWYYDPEPIRKWLDSLPKPIAIMTCDDNQGHHISEICKQYNFKVPEEIALLGVDDDDAICSLSDPPLSSLSQAVENGGYEVAQMITQFLSDSNPKWRDVIVLPTHIVTRESTDIYATNDSHVSTVLKYIHQNIDKKLTVNDIIKLVPLSRRLLEIRFKEVTGLPIYTYISNLRIDKFAKKLIETETPIVDLVFEMGFMDYKNISRQFKKAKGYNPSDYRVKYSLNKRGK